MNVEKKYFFGLLVLSLIVLGIVGVVAYGTSSPSNFGHSVGEINWDEAIPKLCLGGLGGNCIISWADVNGSNATFVSSSGVSKIIAGSGIAISPLNGTGNVEVNVSPSVVIPRGMLAPFAVKDDASPTTPCPPGWEHYSQLDDAVPRGTKITELSAKLGTTGGAGTHAHFISGARARGREDASAAQDQLWTQQASSWPPYIHVIWCKKN